MIVGALFGLGLGIVNGLLITVGRINSFIATLASSFMFYGLGQVMTNGFLVSGDRIRPSLRSATTASRE